MLLWLEWMDLSLTKKFFSFKFDWGSLIVCIIKIAVTKIKAFIPFMKTLSCSEG